MANRSSRSKKNFDSSNHEDSKVAPLDIQEISFTDKEGRTIKIPAVDKHFMEERQFALYKPCCLFDDREDIDFATAAAAKEEWMQRMQYMQQDLHWLLKLPHHKFWSQVVHDESLHQSLDSYLSHAPRDFDLNSSIEEDLLSVLHQVHRLVFFVYLRMSTYKESKKNFISPEAFGEMIYNNYLFDVPKIMDLCALYGRTNGSILKKMISNVFSTQPSYVDDLETTVPHLCMVFDLVEEQLNLNKNHDEMIPARLGERVSSGISSVPTSTLLDVVYYITDISSTINAFIEIYPQSSQLFYNHQIVKRLASFYDTIFPPIESELLIRENEEIQKVLERFKYRVQLTKTLLVKIFRNLIAVCCVQPIIESQCNNAGDGEVTFRHFEEYMEIFTEVVDHKHFICDYNQMFPFETDIEMLTEAGVSFDPTRLEYVFSSIHQYSDFEVCNGGPSLPNKLAEGSSRNYRNGVGKQHNVKDLQSLAATLTNGTLSSKNSEADLSKLGASGPCIDDVKLESLIISVLDVLPSFGPGFVEECLKYYSYDSEKVIDVLLLDKLPECLQKLDRSLQRTYVPKIEEPLSVLSERRNVFDNDEFDLFNRLDVDMQRIHQGKKNKTPDTYQGLSDSSAEITNLLKEISLSSVNEDDDWRDGTYYKEPDLYEDDYDDTYDSSMVGLVELQTEKELQSVRPFTTPRVLQQRKRSPELQNFKDGEVEEDEEEEEPEPVLPKRDEFVPNPEVLREKAEQRREAMARNRRPHNARGNPQGQGSQDRPQQNRKHKEKHKGQVANHNRRQQADYKRSRGMGALPTR